MRLPGASDSFLKGSPGSFEPGLPFPFVFLEQGGWVCAKGYGSANQILASRPEQGGTAEQPLLKAYFQRLLRYPPVCSKFPGSRLLPFLVIRVFLTA